MENANIQLDAVQIAFRKLSQNLLCFVEIQSLILREDGHDTIETLIRLEYNVIHGWCELETKLNINLGRKTFGDLKTDRLQALSLWATDLHLTGKDIDITQFDNAALIGCVDTSKLVYLRSMAKSEIDKPAKFTV